MTRTITIKDGDRTYSGRAGTITSTRLGVQEHGIMTAYLTVEWQKGGVGVGGFALASYDKDLDRHIGSAYGMDHVMRILDTVGVEKWEDLRGKQVIVLFGDDGGWGSRSVGIAHITDERKIFVMAEHAALWAERQGLA